MNTKKRRLYHLIISLLLAVCLLTGCITSPRKEPGSAQTETESTKASESESYESLHEDSLKTQESFDLLTEDLFKDYVTQNLINLHYTLAHPENFGITEYPITYGDFTIPVMQKEMKEDKELLDTLDSIDRKHLTKDQQLTYDILKSYLKTELLSEGMELYYEPLAPTIGLQAQLPVLLAEYTFYDKQDVEDYLGLLNKTDEYYAQLIDFEKQKSEAGLFMCDPVLDQVLDSCEGYLLSPEHSFLTETFATRLDTVEGLTEEEKNSYIEQNRQALEEHFIPAYQLLKDELEKLRGTGTTDSGMWSLPKGSDYYKYLIASATGTSYNTVEELKKAIEGQINSDLLSMSLILKENDQISGLLDNYSFKLTDPEAILEDLRGQVNKDFPELPECNYTVKYVPKALEQSLSPAFYLTPPLDNFKDNVIYINGREENSNVDLYTMLAHEGYPGHLYQNVYFSSLEPCHLRMLLSFSSYSEGWATYVENYSYGLDNGLDPKLAQVLAYNNAVTLGLHALLDININYFKWTKEDTANYLGQYYNIEGTNIVDDIYYTMIANPTNYLEYYVGYLEIINMRNQAQKKQKEQFDLKEFHKFILDIGPAPFNVITSYFKEWMLLP